MLKIIFSTFIVIFFHISCFAQVVNGNVRDSDTHEPLIGATVHWMNSNIGTVSDTKGNFQINSVKYPIFLIVSYVGYKPDTLLIEDYQEHLPVPLMTNAKFEEVIIKTKSEALAFSTVNRLNIEKIDSKEFRKAACCSLAESFQSNNSVDMQFTDAITGAKEIQFLGLRGIYTQLLIQNRPSLQGVLSAYGYDLIPGTWLNTIQISKGASTVKNGAESIAGTINVELKNPAEDYPLYVNAFGNTHGRYELNTHINKKISESNSLGFFLNGTTHQSQRDHNADSFQDEAKIDGLNGLMRYISLGTPWEGQVNIHAVSNKRSSGQINIENPYRSNQHIEHYDLFGNLGYVGFEDESKNIGSIWNISKSRLDGKFGNKTFLAHEQKLFGQLLFQTEIESPDHKLITGVNGQWLIADEKLNSQALNYQDNISGIFAEYTFQKSEDVEGHNAGDPNHKHVEFWDQLSSTLGLRLDHHPEYGTEFIPRLNLKYSVNDNNVFRLSTGKGVRYPRIYSENIGLMSNAKTWNIDKNINRKEIAWNGGINFTSMIPARGKDITINVDLYRTEFVEQVLVDLDADYNQIFIYNPDGNSTSNSFVVTTSGNINSLFRLKLGYKLNDSKMAYLSGSKLPPLFAKHRGLVSLDFETKDKAFLANITSHIVGPQRLADKNQVPTHLLHGHPSKTDAYALVQTQLTYQKKNFEVYIGAENLTNYTLHNPIIDPQNPFGQYFNASEIWAPIEGIKPYVGIKWHL